MFLTLTRTAPFVWRSFQLWHGRTPTPSRDVRKIKKWWACWWARVLQASDGVSSWRHAAVGLFIAEPERNRRGPFFLYLFLKTTPSLPTPSMNIPTQVNSLLSCSSSNNDSSFCSFPYLVAVLMISGGDPTSIAPQFFNELLKREIGRRRCAAAGCSHFMALDADEFYIEVLSIALNFISSLSMALQSLTPHFRRTSCAFWNQRWSLSGLMLQCVGTIWLILQLRALFETPHPYPPN